MTTRTTTPPYSPMTSPLFPSRIHYVWDMLTRPSIPLEGEPLRRTRLMLSMLIIILPLVYIFATIEFTIQFTLRDTPDLSSFAVEAGAALVLTLCYLFGKTRYYQAALIMLVSIPAAAVILSAPFTDLGQNAVYFVALTPLLASILLSTRSTQIATGISFAGLLTLILLHTGHSWEFTELYDELIFVAGVSALLVVSSSIRQQYLDQINAQVIELEKARQAESTARHLAETANQVKSAFLASMSHELRTPLNSIINFTKFLERGMMGEVNEEQKETLGEIVENSEHLLSLINDVLDMSKIESGSLKLFVEDDIDVSELLQVAVSTARSLLHEKSVTVQTDFADNLPKIRADRQRILQILLNIVSNACKFTPEGAIAIKARVDTRTEGDILRVAIRDNGPGIAQNDSEAVFASFKQTKTGLRLGGGTGLGMPISKSLAEAHGGKLWFESVVGEGATFFVELPVKSAALEVTL